MWALSWRADPCARRIADRHYNRQKVGAAQFVPPGRCLVLATPDALWVTSWPFAAFVKHAWAGAWVCSAFRREGGEGRASDLIREAVAATRWRYGEPPELGMVTFLDREKVRPIRRRRGSAVMGPHILVQIGKPWYFVWGWTWLCVGFLCVGETKGGLLVFQLCPGRMPAAAPPRGATLRFTGCRAGPRCGGGDEP